MTPRDGSVDLDDVRAPISRARVALLVGAERTGLSDAALERATHRARIPMAAGVDSLNVAAATAIACHVLRPR